MSTSRVALLLVALACAGCPPVQPPGPPLTPRAQATPPQAEQAPRAGGGSSSYGEAEPQGAPPEQVLLCDGETCAELPPPPLRDRAVGERLARELMTKWQAKHPEVDWAVDERRAHALVPAADNAHLVADGAGTYSRFTRVDVELWKVETERFALAGSRVFHSADELGSTIAVSCDMCHPHAANTHPETYPKYQTQLGRAVLLRDMINWCIEHPVRGEPLEPDDPRLRALEAYIYAQRSGTKLSYGKH